MSDETTSKTRTSRAPTAPSVDEAVTMLAELRTRVEDATGEIERLTTELVERSRALDQLESATDALLGVVDTPVILVGEDRRVRAMTRGAADVLDVQGSHVGRALSAVLPAALHDEVTERLDAGGEGAEAGETGEGTVVVRVLESGAALVVLRPT